MALCDLTVRKQQFDSSLSEDTYSPNIISISSPQQFFTSECAIAAAPNRTSKILTLLEGF